MANQITRPWSQNDSRELPYTQQEWFRQQKTNAFSILKKSVAGGVTVNLTSDESHSNILEFSGALSANINVIISTNQWQFTVFNNTSGAFTLTVKTLSGTGIAVGQGKRAILYCDGTNVVRATADV